MRKKIRFKPIGVILLAMLVITFACNKEDLQPGWNPFKSETIVLEELVKIDEGIKNHIDKARTTQGIYYWAPDTLTLNGPVGYYPLYTRATDEFCLAWQMLLMPDTNDLGTNNEQARINESFLKLRREHTEGEAFDKMRLMVHKDIYEKCPRLGERFLTAEMEYLTTQLGGNADWYSGTRSEEMEKAIAMLPYTPDTEYQDPWGCNCSPYTYILEGYKEYAEGNQKSYNGVDKAEHIKNVQTYSTQERFEKLQEYNVGDFEYKTQYYEDDEGKGVYYIDIPINSYKK